MPYIFNKYYPGRKIVFFLGEGTLIFLSMLFVFWLFKGTNHFVVGFSLYASQAVLVTATFQLSLYFFDLYDVFNDLSMPDTAARLTQAFGTGCIFLSVIYYLVPPAMITSKIFWSGYLVISLVLLGYRLLYYRVLRRRLFAQGVVVIGSGKQANDISREIEGNPESFYKVLAFVGDSSPKYNPNNVPVVQTLEAALEMVDTQGVERIIVAPEERRGTTPIRILLRCKMRGIAIEQGVSFYERLTGKILVERVDPSWIIFSDGFILGHWKKMLKRALDLIIAAVLLVLSLPVMLLSALIIKLESPGPIFYLQERVGKNNAIFKVIKFRSMCQDAEINGAVWAQKNDSRVTRFGGFIRKVRIDEIPQLWNVLRGEMSLVGPRPERQIFVEELVKDIPYYNIRHGVKPGITGWAQICYPYGASKEDALRKLEYDLYYIKNNSLALDLLVIFHTIRTVLFRKGSR